MKDPCEWNPVKHEAAAHVNGVPVDGSCANNADLILGGNRINWRLCQRCYDQDRAQFSKYHRKVRRIEKEKPMNTIKAVQDIQGRRSDFASGDSGKGQAH